MGDWGWTTAWIQLKCSMSISTEVVPRDGERACEKKVKLWNKPSPLFHSLFLWVQEEFEPVTHDIVTLTNNKVQMALQLQNQWLWGKILK